MSIDLDLIRLFQAMQTKSMMAALINEPITFVNNETEFWPAAMTLSLFTPL